MPRPELRQVAQIILDQALAAANPAQAVRQALEPQGQGRFRLDGQILDLSAYRRVICVGAGKAGAPMARALEERLENHLEGGLVIVKDGHGGPTSLVRIAEASHPVPDQRGVAAAVQLAELLESADQDTLVFCLISGGGSALMVAPAPGIGLADKQETTRLLLSCGADIGQINTIRKHLSSLKGGGLARLAHPARVISLIISDVVGDRLDVIASGPTVADNSTWADCGEILDRYALWDRVPAPVAARVRDGLAGRLPDTPKPGSPELARASNHLIATNRKCMEVAAGAARRQGFLPMILSSTIEGETRDIARMHVAMATECLQSGHPLAPPCCLISGGETTVSLGDSPGLGGRNQEFALAAALDLAGTEGVLAVSLGTDGTDGPTDAAGAWADGRSVARGRAKGLEAKDFLARHDAYHFLEALDDLIITGPTRTNVMDLRLMLVRGQE